MNKRSNFTVMRQLVGLVRPLAGYLALAVLLGLAAVFAVLRAGLRYGEQTCNHFVAFKLLALLRDWVFRALRRLAPAKLESRNRCRRTAPRSPNLKNNDSRRPRFARRFPTQRGRSC